jgi:hypothetical protein
MLLYVFRYLLESLYFIQQWFFIYIAHHQNHIFILEIIKNFIR